MVDLSLSDGWFEPHRRHCVVSLSKTLYPQLKARKHVDLTEKCWLGCEASSHQLKQNKRHKYNEPRHEISNNVVCATSKASDQPAHTHSLIRAFPSRFNIL